MTRRVFLNKHQCQSDDTGKRNVHGAIRQYFLLLIGQRRKFIGELQCVPSIVHLLPCRSNKLKVHRKERIYYGK